MCNLLGLGFYWFIGNAGPKTVFKYFWTNSFPLTVCIWHTHITVKSRPTSMTPGDPVHVCKICRPPESNLVQVFTIRGEKCQKLQIMLNMSKMSSISKKSNMSKISNILICQKCQIGLCQECQKCQIWQKCDIGLCRKCKNVKYAKC